MAGFRRQAGDAALFSRIWCLLALISGDDFQIRETKLIGRGKDRRAIKLG